MNNNEDILYSPVENHNQPEKQESEVGFSVKFVEWDAIVEQISEELAIEVVTITAPSRKLDWKWYVADVLHFTVIPVDDDLSDDLSDDLWDEQWDEVEEFN